MKIDFKSEIATYRAPRTGFEIVTVPSLWFLMIDGAGDPNTSPAYDEALRSLYPLAYAVKFLSKNDLGRDYTVMPLEGLWWSADLDAFTTARDKSRWEWTMMIMVPDWITPAQVEECRRTVARKGAAPALEQVRHQRYDEGLVAQTLHLGRYDDEGPTLAALHQEFLPDNDLRPTGKHHEIYLSDARRTAPEKLRTILRQPVEARPV